MAKKAAKKVTKRVTTKPQVQADPSVEVEASVPPVEAEEGETNEAGRYQQMADEAAAKRSSNEK